MRTFCGNEKVANGFCHKSFTFPLVSLPPHTNIDNIPVKTSVSKIAKHVGVESQVCPAIRIKGEKIQSRKKLYTGRKNCLIERLIKVNGSGREMRRDEWLFTDVASLNT